MPQIKELLEQYGDILTIWFDRPPRSRPTRGSSCGNSYTTLRRGAKKIVMKQLMGLRVRGLVFEKL